MQTAVVMKPVSQFAEPAFVQTTESLDRMAAFMELIASRAYDIFENRGRKHGNDLEDWRHAEEELFHTAHVHLDESNDALSLNAEVAGFSCEDLEVSVEPRRVTITGRRASNGITTRKVIYCDACADRIFRALRLPVEIDPKKASAVLKDGILQVALPKASPTLTVEIRTLSIVRAEDARLWTESLAKLFRRSE
jgi:HSP20 family molecular chaperone IbpA